MLTLTKSAPPAPRTTTQQVRSEIEQRMVSMLLAGNWLTESTVDLLLAEAQEAALLHVMDGLPPDLRTLASHERDRIRQLVNRRMKDAANRQED